MYMLQYKRIRVVCASVKCLASIPPHVQPCFHTLALSSFALYKVYFIFYGERVGEHK